MKSGDPPSLREALDKNTSSDRLRELFFTNRDPQIEQAIAQNPNTPLHILEALSYSYPIEAINNSSLPLLFSAKPESIRPKALSFLRCFIKNPQTPISFLKWFLNNDSIDLIPDHFWQLPNWFLNDISHDFPLEELNHALISRIYFHHLGNHDLPENILELLANISLNKGIIGMGRLLAKDPYTSSNILNILMQSFVIKHPNCPNSVLKILAQDGNKTVRKWVV